mmetsp:Transcript_34265/g.74734  ORF Transcript_34265/g.74734 Transcript_34265/m.74734 type:complete len:210 (+) Transcript_34265:164-793(+)
MRILCSRLKMKRYSLPSFHLGFSVSPSVELRILKVPTEISTKGSQELCPRKPVSAGWSSLASQISTSSSPSGTGDLRETRSSRAISFRILRSSLCGRTIISVTIFTIVRCMTNFISGTMSPKCPRSSKPPNISFRSGASAKKTCCAEKQGGSLLSGASTMDMTPLKSTPLQKMFRVDRCMPPGPTPFKVGFARKVFVDHSTAMSTRRPL